MQITLLSMSNDRSLKLHCESTVSFHALRNDASIRPFCCQLAPSVLGPARSISTPPHYLPVHVPTIISVCIGRQSPWVVRHLAQRGRLERQRTERSRDPCMDSFACGLYDPQGSGNLLTLGGCLTVKICRPPGQTRDATRFWPTQL